MAILASLGHIGDIATSSTLEKEWYSSAAMTAPVREATIVRGGGEKWSCKISALASGVAKGLNTRYIAATTNGHVYFFRIPIYVVTRPSAENVIAGEGSAETGIEWNLRLKSTGEIEIRDGSVVVGTSQLLDLNTWHEIDVMVKHDGTTPNAGADFLTLKVNGTEIVSSTTQSLGSRRHFTIGGNLAAEAQTQGEWYFGGIVINNDQAGGGFTSYMPAGLRLAYLRPTGTGTFSETTVTGGDANAWQALDDEPINTATRSDSLTNSASWASAASRLLMAFQNLADVGLAAADAIQWVAVGGLFRGATGSTNAAVPGIRSGGTNADMGTSRTNTSAAFCFYSASVGLNVYEVQYVDPTDAGAWTQAKIDNAEFGFRGSDCNPDNWCAEAWVLVAFVPRHRPRPIIINQAVNRAGTF